MNSGSTERLKVAVVSRNRTFVILPKYWIPNTITLIHYAHLPVKVDVTDIYRNLELMTCNTFIGNLHSQTTKPPQTAAEEVWLKSEIWVRSLQDGVCCTPLLGLHSAITSGRTWRSKTLLHGQLIGNGRGKASVLSVEPFSEAEHLVSEDSLFHSKGWEIPHSFTVKDEKFLIVRGLARSKRHRFQHAFSCKGQTGISQTSTIPLPGHKCKGKQFTCGKRCFDKPLPSCRSWTDGEMAFPFLMYTACFASERLTTFLPRFQPNFLKYHVRSMSFVPPPKLWHFLSNLLGISWLPRWKYNC